MYFRKFCFIRCYAIIYYLSRCVVQEYLFHTLLSKFLLFGQLYISVVFDSFILKQLIIIQTVLCISVVFVSDIVNQGFYYSDHYVFESNMCPSLPSKYLFFGL